MNYTVRIIKPLNGAQETTNFSLGNHYYTYFRDHDNGKHSTDRENIFDQISKRYFEHSPEVAPEKDISDVVVGFVCGSDGKLYPFWDDYQVYIVNENGKTFERVYGMPYSEWKENHQLPATPEQMAAFEARK